MDPEPYCLAFYLTTFSGIFTIKIIVLVLLLAGSALISAAEVALFGLSQTDVNEMNENDSSRSKLIVELLDKPQKLLATILITNNAINIGIVLLFSSIGNTIFEGIDGTLRFILEVVLATFVILMF
ncbi:MAG: DUF21 domain-containing protein, partial [Bacteroidota bacterium]|nr:DUF21 domain-containing protein [Bacteroidota bacterium]